MITLVDVQNAFDVQNTTAKEKPVSCLQCVTDPPETQSYLMRHFGFDLLCDDQLPA